MATFLFSSPWLIFLTFVLLFFSTRSVVSLTAFFCIHGRYYSRFTLFDLPMASKSNHRRWVIVKLNEKKSTSRQRSGKGAIRKRLPLQKPRWEKTKLTIRHLYHENISSPYQYCKCFYYCLDRNNPSYSRLRYIALPFIIGSNHLRPTQCFRSDLV